MATLTIVSGSPGAGKTTLCSTLAKSHPMGLHFPADPFYLMPAFPIDPTKRESASQNEAIIRATGAAASVFLRFGYEVFLDGIYGPWFLEALLEEIEIEFAVDYVLLSTDSTRAVERVRNREGSGQSPRVVATQKSFAKSDGFDTHRIDTSPLSPEEVAQQVRDGLAAERFRLDRG